MAPRLRFLVAALLGLATAGCALFASSAKAPNADAGKILVRYQLASDSSAPAPTGYHVHRANSFHGPFERLTEKPIAPPRGRPGETVTLFVDRDVRLGQTYYYYLESVDRRGVTSKASEVVAARAVLPLQVEDRAVAPVAPTATPKPTPTPKSAAR
jgi:hypothetical protein